MGGHCPAYGDQLQLWDSAVTRSLTYLYVHVFGGTLEENLNKQRGEHANSKYCGKAPAGKRNQDFLGTVQSADPLCHVFSFSQCKKAKTQSEHKPASFPVLIKCVIAIYRQN